LLERGPRETTENLLPETEKKSPLLGQNEEGTEVEAIPGKEGRGGRKRAIVV